MSNTVLKCHSLITAITINGVAYVPDGSGLITVPSGTATSIMKGTLMHKQEGPITISSVPTDPTT